MSRTTGCRAAGSTRPQTGTPTRGRGGPITSPGSCSTIPACSAFRTRRTSRSPSRYLADGLYHADTLLNSREARSAKAERYERLHPGKRVAGRPLNEAFYLPKLVDPPTAEVAAADLTRVEEVLAARPSAAGSRAEVGSAGREEIDRLWAGACCSSPRTWPA
jgi:hypothetical protein